MEELKNIVEQCVSGNVRAQETLYRMFAPKMFGVCLRYSKDYTEAEDSLQEGFVKVFTHLKNFRHEGSLEGWIRRIMVNVSIEKFRKQQMLFTVEDMRVFEGQQQQQEGIIEKISAGELIELIQGLTPKYRMVFNLYVIEGMNHKEIAEAMNITEGTSKSNLARARDILKQRVSELHGERYDIHNFSA